MKEKVVLALGSALALLLVFAACRTVPTNSGGGTTDTALNGRTDSTLYSSIRGEVREGPISPVERPGVDNSAPLAGAPIEITSANGSTMTVTSDPGGKFLAKVVAGTYVCVPKVFTASGLPRPQGSVTVTVPPQTTVDVALSYDTGIR